MISAMFDMICAVPDKQNKLNPIVEQISNIKQQQDLVEGLFNLCDDDDLIEACCYQSKAFSAYYRYLLKQVRNDSASEKKVERIGGFVG